MLRLPQDGQSAELNRNAIDESILSLLKEMQYGTMSNTEPRRKRKLNVVAGQSVAAEDTEALEDAEDETSIKKTKRITGVNQPSTSHIPANNTDRIRVKGNGTGKKNKKSIDIEDKTLKKVTVLNVI